MKDLAPCPFCGGKASLVYDLSENSTKVYCTRCHISTPKAYVRRRNFVKKGVGGRNFKNDEYAEAWIVQLWNTRSCTNEDSPNGYKLAEGEVI